MFGGVVVWATVVTDSLKLSIQCARSRGVGIEGYRQCDCCAPSSARCSYVDDDVVMPEGDYANSSHVWAVR